MGKNENKKNGIVDEALLDIQRIQEALNTNSKEILRSVAREEIESIVKKSLNEDFEEEDVDDTVETLPTDGEGSDIEANDFESGEGEIETDVVSSDVEASPEIGGELDADPIGSEIDSLSPESELDLTSASDADVIAIYKKMSGEDEIEVVGDEVHLTVSEPGEYILKPNKSGAPVGDAPIGAEPVGNIGLGGGDELGAETDFGSEESGEEVSDFGSEESTEETPEFGSEESGEEEVSAEIGSEEESEESEPELEEEGTVYEITGIVESEGAHAEHVKPTKAPNTGDIDKQKSKELPKSQTGDNLVGGFKEAEGKNGSGDAHAKHIMNATGKTDPTAKTKATAKPGEEKAGKGSHGEHIMETEDEVVEAVEAIEEKIQVGKGRTVANGKTSIVGAGGKANNVKDGNVTAESKTGVKVLTESQKKYNSLLSEAISLKEENNAFKKSLKEFRRMLGETVVFNSNLTYATKLFLEHATTKEEKRAIIKRFDEESKSLEGSKKLYKSIVSELESRNSMNENFQTKITKDVTTGTSSVLNERNAYVDKESKRIIDLMERVEGKNRL